MCSMWDSSNQKIVYNMHAPLASTSYGNWQWQEVYVIVPLNC